MSHTPAVRLWGDELIVDSFAGGGGASLGIELALGRSPDIAINHDAEAIALHAANHPDSKHYCEDVWQVDPVEATQGKPVGLMWLSPDCKHFSKAKGGKPVSKKVRGLAWVAVRWAKAVQPRVIVLENVEEFQTWGPVDRETNRPDPTRRGLTFRRFVGRLRGLGYQVEHRQLCGADFGAPTTRTRLFLIARRDGLPIVWPAPSHAKHGRGGLPKWRAFGELIEWSVPCPSIFTRRKPLAAKTQRRVARGIFRYVLDSDAPYLVDRAAPFLTEHANGSTQRNFPADEPMRTLCAEVKGGHFALVAAFLAKHYTERDTRETMASSLFAPIATITTQDHHGLVEVALRGDHRDDVCAFLAGYYGNERDGSDLFAPIRTLTTKERYAVVTTHGREPIMDIGHRMLTARECYRGQGFPDSYRINIPFNGRPLPKAAQIRMCGNSVAPHVARAIIAANCLESSVRPVAPTGERAA